MGARWLCSSRPEKPVRPYSMFTSFVCAIFFCFTGFSIRFCNTKLGHMIKCLLTELGRAVQENIWLLVITGPLCAHSVRHDLEPNIFPSGPPTQSISTSLLIHVSQANQAQSDMVKYCHNNNNTLLGGKSRPI